MGKIFAKKTGHRPDYFLIATIFILTVIGLAMLASASSDLGKTRFDDSYFYLKHQIVNGLIPGLIGFFLTYKIYYQNYRKLALPFLLLNIAFLGLVFTGYGIEIGGARRWIALGPVSFQPAELLKLSFIVYVAAWLSRKTRGRTIAVSTPFFLIISGLVAGLLILQPSTSMVIILIASGFLVYFLSDPPWKHVMALILLGTVAIGAVIYATPYRLERIVTFFNPQRDTEGTGFHITKALEAIKSGGVLGVGYGESRTKASLPASIDDSIFAVTAEELGFVGAGVLIVLFAAFTLRLFWISRRAGDRFGELMLVGFASIIALQSLVNIGAISGLLPLTGLPLPFVSYGGTALATFLTMGGIMANISKYT